MVIRENAKEVKVYNSGLIVFLYDEANSQAIITAEPNILKSFGGDDDLQDKKLKALAKEGLLVTYELMQDDPVNVAVSVGLPLASREKKKLAWMKPQTALLSLPSGKLCIDTYDTLRLNTDEEPAESGAVISVPSGDYVLTLHRVDWSGMEKKGIDTFEGPYEFVSLTPLAEAKPVNKPAAVLRYLPDLAKWRGKYKIKDGVFTGKFIQAYETVWINFDPKAAEIMGLERNMRLLLEAGNEKLTAVFIGNVDPLNEWHRVVYNSNEITQMQKNNSCTASWGYPIYGQKIQTLRFMPFRLEWGKWLLQKSDAKIPVTVKILPDNFASVPEQGWIKRWSANNGTIKAEVLGSDENGIILNVGTDALARINALPEKEKPVELSLQTKDLPRKLIYCASNGEFKRESKKPPAENLEEIKKIEEELKVIDSQQKTLWNQLYRDKTFPAGSLEEKKAELKMRKLTDKVNKLYRWLKELKQPHLSKIPVLGGILIPHWDVPDHQVLSCQPLFDGTKTELSAKTGDKVTIAVNSH